MQENPFKNDQKNYCTFYIVRHGETQWNVDRKIQGHRNSPLTEEGLKQIKEIAKELRKIKFHTVFSSDLLRAKRTAEVVALEHNLAVHTTKLLRERRYGKYEGKPSEVLTEFHKLFDRLTTAERMAYKISQDVESDNEMIARF
ncbi:histidine phosphatase family protein, partial [Candidatus Gottesmanbacteria bacterium]|nr:histidine phosphatase family protein [Candidatus Gottesmanbacteria bacterium]